MLQQTQVQTVIDYFNRFIQRFSSVEKLAAASLDEVLHLWTGLGYYSRARNLHKTAQIIATQYNGRFPDKVEQLQQLPGIGRSTAGAIASFAYQESAAILDGNVKRVFCRVFAVEGWAGLSNVQKILWELVEKYKPKKNIAAYNQALMDIGALICTRSKPQCAICPLQKNCQAFINDLTDQLPTKKQKKIVPIRKTHFLIIENQQGHILLQQRPPAGIWGGLWCFPEIQSDKTVERWCQQQLGLQVKAIEQYKQFRHSFSHYHLDITALKMRVVGKQQHSIGEPKQQIWFAGSKSPLIGFAAPVKKLLTEVMENK